jgi:hypothetical protein
MSNASHTPAINPAHRSLIADPVEQPGGLLAVTAHRAAVSNCRPQCGAVRLAGGATKWNGWFFWWGSFCLLLRLQS